RVRRLEAVVLGGDVPQLADVRPALLRLRLVELVEEVAPVRRALEDRVEQCREVVLRRQLGQLVDRARELRERARLPRAERMLPRALRELRWQRRRRSATGRLVEQAHVLG